MVTYHEITPAGLANLKQEVADLKAIRPAKIKHLAEAAALGDRSENAEYSAAKRELRQLEGRLRYLDKLIRYAKVTTPAAANLADIGNWVTLEFDDDQDEDTYELVGPRLWPLVRMRPVSQSSSTTEQTPRFMGGNFQC